MDISSLTNISSDYLNQIAQQNRLVTTDDDSFSSVLSSAMNMVSETNDLQKAAAREMHLLISIQRLPVCVPKYSEY